MNVRFERLLKHDPLVQATDRNFQELQSRLPSVNPVKREYIDCTSGSVTRYLPRGVQTEYDFFYLKTDSSANVVSIQPTSPDTLFYDPTTGLTYTEVELAMQNAYALLSFRAGIWYLIGQS